MTIGKFGIAAALLAAGTMLPGAALAKKSKGLIKANANGKFKANQTKVASYTAANGELSISGVQRKGAVAKNLTILCVGIDMTPGTHDTECLGTFFNLAPLKGINQEWSFADGGHLSLVIQSYDGKTLKATFTADAPGTSGNGNKPLTVTGGVIKMPVTTN